MSKFTITALVAALVALGACANGSNSADEEFVVVVPEPITTEPAYTGKYK
ncbi:MAG: hypothetical protein ABF310_09540 [Paracoccaceae bacterium]|jgi:hypothetical protein